ncbi:unnamed protein product [Echinostoma caproni]|uniref:ASH domain-containing protein n=1 Tax=Echinostoma caproni TaxID=27848 RepID=A0A183A5S5_9TREM|nr:unnamed protein product [Echinostoma caproni]
MLSEQSCSLVPQTQETGLEYWSGEETECQKEYSQLKNEMKISDERVSQLTKETERTTDELKQCIAEKNMASLYRLQKKLSKLEKELKHERLDNIAVQRARQKAELISIKNEENALRMKSEQELDDPDVTIALHARMAQIEAHQRAFSQAQNYRRLEIVNKLLMEEQNQKKKIQTLPELYGKSRIPPIENLDKPERISHLERNLISGILGQTSNVEGTEMLDNALRRTRENIVQPQRVGVREFHGKPFMISPKEIWFKDFDINVEMQMKLILTNASYKAICCRYVGMTATLLDFVNIRFTPPGALSPGMSCSLDVTFLPKLDRDLFGQVKFLCPTGPFSIPFKATTKKCVVSIDQTLVDFGSVVIGETVRRSIRLSNTGAKGVRFRAFRALDLLSVSNHSSPTNTVENQVREEMQSGQSNQLACEEVSTKTQLNQPNDRPENTSTELDGDDNTDTGISPDVLNDALDKIQLDVSPQFTLCGSTEGFLQPFSTTSMEIVWNPKILTPIYSDDSNSLLSVETELFLIQFDDPMAETIRVQAQGQPRELPTWLSTETLEMGICWFDRLYQDCFAVHNRTNTALKVTFYLSDQMANHMEVLPKTGFVQAQSRLLAQVKFLPRTSLEKDIGSSNPKGGTPISGFIPDEDLKPDYDPHTGVLHVPVKACVAGQTYMLRLVMAAIVTCSDLELSPQRIDFGVANVTETVTARLSLINHSLLPQTFGIVDSPEYVEIQPNDGFGTILPNETLELELLFSPTKAKDYDFKLTCKSGIGRSFCVFCHGVGVFTPLRLSAYKIQLPPTPLDESSSVIFTVENIHVSSNPYTHVQPRIGSKGPFAPVGPTAYEFVPIDSVCTDPTSLWGEQHGTPEKECGAFLTVMPSSGTLQPGEKNRVTICFRPSFHKKMVQNEAALMYNERRIRALAEAAACAAPVEPVDVKPTKSGARRDKINAEIKSTGTLSKKSGKSTELVTTKEEKDEPFVPVDADSLGEDSVEYRGALSELLRVFPRKPVHNSGDSRTESAELQHDQPDGNWPGCQMVYRLACFIADGPGSEYPAEPLPKFKTENTMFLEVTCPIARPALMVVASEGQAKIDFGSISSGQQKIACLSVENISPYRLKITTKPLNPIGPFELVHVRRVLDPGERTPIKVKFQPSPKHEWCSDSLSLMAIPEDQPVIRDVADSLVQLPLTIKLIGFCVVPKVELTAIRGLSTDSHTDDKGFLRPVHLLHFGCVLVPEYAEIELSVTNPTAVLVEFHLMSDPSAIKGTQNTNGSPVFVCAPSNGIIEPGGVKTISVIFAPDHSSDLYHEAFVLTLNRQPTNCHVIVMRGMGKSHSVYVHGSELTRSDKIRNSYLGSQLDGAHDSSSVPTSTFHLVIRASRRKETKTDQPEPEVANPQETDILRFLRVGCVSSQVSTAKKNAEYSVENMNELAAQGFSITPSKGSVEPGSEQILLCTWIPTPDIQIGAIVQASAKIVTKADITSQHVVHLLGIG